MHPYNSSNVSLNKSSYSYNDSSYSESTSNSRLADNINRESDNQHSTRNASVSPTFRRHDNTLQRTIRRFHSAFIEKHFLGYNKNLEKEIDEETNHKNNKVRSI